MIYKNILRSGIILLLFCLFACKPEKQIQETIWQGETMGTVFNVRIVHKGIEQNSLQTLKNNIDSALVEVNRQMSTYIPDSEISLFNKHLSAEDFRVSSGFASVVRRSLHYYNLSQGAFDVTIAPLIDLWGFGKKGRRIRVPVQTEIDEALEVIGSSNLEITSDNYLKKKVPQLELDLSAIAKGYGVDVVAGEINKFNIHNYMVEIGGEIFAKGLNFKSEKWHIGIDKPNLDALPGENLQQIIAISGEGMATSGDYRNYFEQDEKIFSHTINPVTGKPVDHKLASVTVIANTCMDADALATAVMVMGPDKGINLINSIKNTEALLISRLSPQNFEIIFSEGFEKFLVD